MTVVWPRRGATLPGRSRLPIIDESLAPGHLELGRHVNSVSSFGHMHAPMLQEENVLLATHHSLCGPQYRFRDITNSRER